MRRLGLRIWHYLTGAHIDDSSKPSSLAMCNCGWKDDIFRTTLRERVKRLLCALRGHAWDDPEESSFGPIDHTPETADARWASRQCVRCYTVKIVPLAELDE